MGILENKGLYFPLMFPSIKPMSFYFILKFSWCSKGTGEVLQQKKKINYMGISENKGLYFTPAQFSISTKNSLQNFRLWERISKYTKKNLEGFYMLGVNPYKAMIYNIWNHIFPR